ncbi:MAG: SPOR domain-containing protein [Betaproteobacteria bacterium]|jgi:cell division protein FtsN|nr:SPOR domain-containing protein [Betaproteobacteria bacterium]
MKDYKPRGKPARKSAVGGTLIGIFVGLLLGIGIAAAIAVYMTKSPAPFVDRTHQTERSAPAKAAANLAEAQAPGVPKAPERPRFDFYKILPGQEVPVSERELRAAAKDVGKAGSLPKDTYFIQAGSFQNPAEADNLKAKLALLGLQASVEPANLPDRGTWYRVRLGPYARLGDIDRVRQTLAQNGVEAQMVRLKN